MFLWHKLRQEKRPILLYGMGNGAQKLLHLAKDYGITVSGIFASNEHSRDGLIFQGFPVMSLDYALQTYRDPIILVAFGVYQEDVLQRILSLSQKYTLYIPDIPLMGGVPLTPEYLSGHPQQIETVQKLLSDEISRRVFDTMLQAKMTGHISAYFQEDTPRNEDMALLHLGTSERYLDLGAYNGDTIMEFLSLTHGAYGSIDAFEPDNHNFKKLSEAVSPLSHVTIHPKASWREVTTLTFSGKGGRNCAKLPDLPGQYKHLHTVDAIPVDSLQQEFSYINVEGAEKETLLGMVDTINRCHPKMLISAYHKPDDFITLPLLVEQLCPGYRMYLRRNRCLPAWEIQLYCIYPDDSSANSSRI